ncbi:MAG: enoyl-CoA hydratase-related protein [Cyclobacteriaceae bacterium]|nr:enoyl-CoA hydratase-related protein [Cyclobacteriaceae bacterium]
MYKFIIYEVKNNVATITLNRPETYNAVNNGLTYELQDAFKLIAEDEKVRVVVLTGAGKAFCSGQDLKAVMGEENDSFENILKKRYNPLIKQMRELPKPIVARVNGVAAGAGCSLALACDIIVADENAIFVEVFVNIGLVLDSGSSYFLPRLVGSKKAFELATMAKKINGKEAAELGIVNKAVTTEKLNDTVKYYTEYYSKAPTLAIGLMKQMQNKSGNASLDEMLELEMINQQIAGTSLDYEEGVNAFLEKRTPEFKGK